MKFGIGGFFSDNCQADPSFVKNRLFVSRTLLKDLNEFLSILYELFDRFG